MRRSRLNLLSLSNFSTINFSTIKLLTTILCIQICSTLSFAAAPDRITGPINSSQTIALAKSHHPKAQPQYDRGSVDPSFKLSYITLLMAPSPSQQKALNQLLAQQQDPRSPLYHKWLTPQQYADRFGLSQNDLSKITTWLSSEGFQIISIGGGRNTVIFSGTAAQAQRAFGAEIHNYQVDGLEHFANSTPLMIPSALNGIVASVIGLHDFRPLPANGGKHLGAMRNARPEYYDEAYIFPNYLAPGDIYTIYDITSLHNAGYDGTGQTLAIVGQTDVYLNDLNYFRSGFGLTTISSSDCATNSDGVIIPPCTDPLFDYVLNGPDAGVNPQGDDLGEADLDLEWSGATARSAQIIYVNSGGTAGGAYDALTAVISPQSGPPLSKVVSMSYGYCEALATVNLEPLLQQGNAEGVTILNSAADEASAACDSAPPGSTQTYTPPPPFLGAQYGLAVSYPASSPEVTGVGGTEISLANDSYPNPSSYWSTTIGANGGTAQSHIPEIPWNDVEEFADYCHDPAQGDPFCSYGGSPPVTGWVPLTTSATAQQVQEDIWIAGGGGGASNCWYENADDVCLGAGPGPNGGGFAQPLYQQGLSVASAPAGVRYVPDVSLMASPSFPGYIWCTPLSELNEGGSTSSCASGIFIAVDTYFSVVGGTSASSPIFAGIVTLLNQYVVTKGIQTTPGLGNINPNLYQLALSNSSNKVFHQVTTGDNMVYCQQGQPEGFPPGIVCPDTGVFGYEASNADSKTGYNLVTGLGSVDAYNLAQAWASSTTQDFTLPATLTAPTAANPGQSTSTSMALAPVGANSFGSAVTYSCSGLPTGATCSFNPTQISAGGSAQSVTVTVQTAGPFTGTAGDARQGNDRPRLRSQKQRPWLPLSLPLAGMVLVGLAGRGLPRRYKIVGLCLALALTGFLVACGGGSSSPPPVSVTVSPQTVDTLYPSLAGAPAQQQQFTATVNNSTNQSVTWAVLGTGTGTINQTGGLYTAPTALPNPNSPITVTATSAATSSPGTATVNLLAPTPAGPNTVTVTVTEGSIVHTTSFTLTVN
ncbi:MAG: protease pro-enzyme activation domain-containing protein [Terriglobales bacterium]|jgi:hypothetical protein